MTSSTSLIISGSSAEVGSSKSITFGCIARARAIATLCCWPPDSWAGSFAAWSETPTRSSRAMASARASAGLTPRTFTGPKVTLSRTVLWAKRLNDWNTIPTSERNLARALPSAGSGTPSTRIVPVSIVSNRLMARHSVDLPEPEGPTITTTSPVWTDRVMSLRT